MNISRETAWNLLNEFVKSQSLVKHSLCVEAVMRAYAEKYARLDSQSSTRGWGENTEEWGIAGLLHDFDYEKFPDKHPFEGNKILKEKGYPEPIIEAIMGHAAYGNVPRTSRMAKCLFACDELCGFLMAMAYMRPDRLNLIVPDTIRKYLKKKRFAEKVSREEIQQGIEELGIPEDEHFETVVKALRGISEKLGF